MKRRISAMDARRRLGDLLESVYHRGDEVIIERAGKPMAVMIPPERYAALKRDREGSKERLRKLVDEIREDNAGDPPEKIYADIEAAVREVREEHQREEALWDVIERVQRANAHVPPEEILADIEAAIREVRKESSYTA